MYKLKNINKNINGRDIRGKQLQGKTTTIMETQCKELLEETVVKWESTSMVDADGTK